MAQKGSEAENDLQFLRLSSEKLLALQNELSRRYDAKRSVWVADLQNGFLAAEIKQTKSEGELVISISKGADRTVNKEEVQQMNPPKFELSEDMAELTHLNDASVLHNLRSRYENQLIYTYSGLFCVVINPYKWLPIYKESICKMYMGKRRSELPPHIFAVCDEAYRNMVGEAQNQSMLITGESGAGKTENTKKVIAYFAVVGASIHKKSIGGKMEATLEEQIVRTNPVLEAFGNAKTVRNNNSSRFGKYIRIHFNNAGKIAGSDIEHYLLEKSRVIRQAPGERSYHIFYQLMSDGIANLKKSLLLERPITDYRFVSQAEVTIDGVDDKSELMMTDESLNIMNFSAEEKHELYSLIAAIMHMGEMRFKQRPREEQAEADDISEGELACKLLKVDVEQFVSAFLKPKVKIGIEWVNKGQNLEQIQFAVGAVAKTLYARMFTWLIKRCNASLEAKDKRQQDLCIGVLDIAGFEIFDLNSFEQLWINFVNERLQQFFNHHMFVMEQEEYRCEGINWEFIDFGLDLQACIDLIEKPLGIISMLDEECIVPKATDLTFAQKLNDQHLGKHPYFQKPKSPKGKQAEAHFAIVHYAGTVRYNVKFWLEKNKDPVNDSVVAALKSNKGMKLLSAIWEDYQTQGDISEAHSRAKASTTPGKVLKKKGKSASFNTVSMIYRDSLNRLMTMLNQTHPFFIRCIIPNEQKKPGVINANLVLNQLTCNGVLEGIRICRKGYPNRVGYPEFRQRYAILAADQATEKQPKLACERMTKRMADESHLRPEEFQCGKTKVFFRAGVLARLEEKRDEALGKTMLKLQSQCRYYLVQRDLRRRKEQQYGLKIIQRNVQQWSTLREWPWFLLYAHVKPLIQINKKDEEFEILRKQCEDLKTELLESEKQRRHNEELVQKKLNVEIEKLRSTLEQERECLEKAENQSSKLLSKKAELEKQLESLHAELAEREDKEESAQKLRKRAETEVEQLKKQLSEFEASTLRNDYEKQAREGQIRSLQDEIASLDDSVAKLTRERKTQDEMSRKLQEELDTEKDKANQLQKTKHRLEESLDKAEEALERERRGRQDLDKQKRKMEGELKVAQETLEEIARQKIDVENMLKRKDVELASTISRLDDESTNVQRLQRQIKELMLKCQETEEELESERASRAKAEKTRSEMQAEIEEMAERLETAGDSSHAQAEMNKRREAELAKLRKELENFTLQNEVELQKLRKKHNDAVSELTDQMDAVQKQRVKLEKERQSVLRDFETAQSQIELEQKQRQNLERICKQLEQQLLDQQMSNDEQSRQLIELEAFKNRSTSEAQELYKRLEEAESQIAVINRTKAQLLHQIEEQKRQAEQDSRERQQMVAQLAQSQQECQHLREAIDEEAENKNELQRLISKAKAEAAQWRAKFEGEGLVRAEEMEEMRRKLLAKVQEVQDQLEAAQQKNVKLEKIRHKKEQELEDAQLEAERANQLVMALEKKQKGFDKQIEEWMSKCDSLAVELSASQQENRSISTEAIRLRSALDEANEQMESLRRENNTISTELKDLTEELSEGGRNVHELAKMCRRLETEKEELQQALEESESAVEVQQNKNLRAQIEISQIRSEIEKRIQEKNEEYEEQRKSQQRTIETLQSNLDAQLYRNLELEKVRKKLESDLGELEAAFDQAKGTTIEAQKNLKRCQDNMRLLQQQLDDEQSIKDQLQENLSNTERRVYALLQEKDELTVAIAQAERFRAKAEREIADVRDQLVQEEGLNAALFGTKRRLEGENQQLQQDLDQTIADNKGLEENLRFAQADIVRISEELKAEQENSQSIEKQRKLLEIQFRELQQKVEDMDGSAQKSGKRMISKLELKIDELEADLAEESRRLSDSQKQVRNKERQLVELQFQAEEDKKAQERLHALIDALQLKLKQYKLKTEEVEQSASLNITKFKQLQQMLDDAEERAEMAENTMAKMRAQNRSSSNVMKGVVGLSPSMHISPLNRALLHSISSAAVFNPHHSTNGAGEMFGSTLHQNTPSIKLMSESMTDQ